MLRSKRNVRAGAVLPTAAAFAELGSIYLGQTYGSPPEERHKPLPSDDVVPNPQVVTNHATTIDVPLDAVWPWLVQMGWHRAGWYTARWVAIGHIVDLVVVGGAENVPMLALPLGTGHQGQRPQIGSGPHHTAVALAAAIDLAGQAAPASTRPSVAIPVGTAVHTGEAFVGRPGLAQPSAISRRLVMLSTSPRDWHRLRLRAR
jgi:hypothetical protein